MPIPPAKFPELKRDMANDLGFQVTTIGAKQYVRAREVEEDEPDPAPTSDEDAPRRTFTFATQGTAAPPEPRPLATVTALPSVDDETPAVPVLPWEDMVGNDETFLSTWMEDSNDYLPSEYYFWLGLVAVGMGARDRIVLKDRDPVKGNLFVCLTGPTGIGKSRSTRKLQTLIREALPAGEQGSGVRWQETPLSGEALVDMFCEIERDEGMDDQGNVIPIVRHHKVAGIVPFSELSELVKQAAWSGSTLKDRLIAFFDCQPEVTARSRGAGSIVAKEPYASVLSTTQFKSIRTLLAQSDASSGFLNRWIFVGGNAERPPAFEFDMFDPTRSVVKLQEIDASVRHLQPFDPPQFVSASQGAFDALEEYDRDYLWPLKATEDHELLSRAVVLIKKFSLLFAINERSDIVTGTMMARAIALWQYVEQMYAIIGSDLGVGEFDYCKKQIFKTIQDIKAKTGNGPHPKQFMAHMNKFHKDLSSELIDRVLKSMMKNGEVDQVEKQSKSGNVSIRYELAS